MPVPPPDLSTIDKRLLSYGLALQEEHDLIALLTRVLYAARSLTNAEAGTLFLVDGDVLRFTVVQNDFLKRRVGDQHMRQALQTAPLPINNGSLAGYVALSGKTLSIADVYRIPADRPYRFKVAIFEVLSIGPMLRSAILSAASIDDIRAIARREGMVTLREAAVARLVAGDTTLEEVVRTTTLE